MLGEITMLQQLKHRNIMRLYDWWFDKQHQVSQQQVQGPRISAVAHQCSGAIKQEHRILWAVCSSSSVGSRASRTVTTLHGGASRQPCKAKCQLLLIHVRLSVII
jgi:hypothetical protein